MVTIAAMMANAGGAHDACHRLDLGNAVVRNRVLLGDADHAGCNDAE